MTFPILHRKGSLHETLGVAYQRGGMGAVIAVVPLPAVIRCYDFDYNYCSVTNPVCLGTKPTQILPN